MTPKLFDEANAVLRGPEGVSDLPCHIGDDCVVSAWVPNKEEKAAIARGEPVYLCIMGQTHAPLFLSAQKSDIWPIEPEDTEDTSSE